MAQSEQETGQTAEVFCCRCPFCDYAMEMPYPFCQVCGAEICYCEVCGQPLPKDADHCPHCAGEA
jgi:hypothetical protein